MSAAQLTETVRDMIIAQIKATIVAELAAVRADRADPTVDVTSPREYFIYDGAHTYRCPAIFVVVESGVTGDKQRQTNFSDCIYKIFVSAVVEGKNDGTLTRVAERYQSALFKILHETVLSESPQNIKIQLRVEQFKFSPTFTKKRQEGELGEFRKEVALELEVQAWENPTS